MNDIPQKYNILEISCSYEVVINSFFDLVKIQCPALVLFAPYILTDLFPVIYYIRIYPGIFITILQGDSWKLIFFMLLLLSI